MASLEVHPVCIDGWRVFLATRAQDLLWIKQGHRYGGEIMGCFVEIAKVKGEAAKSTEHGRANSPRSVVALSAKDALNAVICFVQRMAGRKKVAPVAKSIKNIAPSMTNKTVSNEQPVCTKPAGYSEASGAASRIERYRSCDRVKETRPALTGSLSF